MNLLEIAHVYIDLVNLEKEIPEEEFRAKEEVGILRSKYHQILMDKMKEEKIEFFDRFDATRMAFDLVSEERN
ncbi:MAG TPA: hypothetical protein DDW49_04350 [Deltaproteobacteria bacterium]|nr:MAG: hypothetical protein A2048_06515 [Deltaproteobacteria bacterium GWA2_45_12]HBF12611.1 hypothetical protein [Deltaproteobacteria bacterium]